MTRISKNFDSYYIHYRSNHPREECNIVLMGDGDYKGNIVFYNEIPPKCNFVTEDGRQIINLCYHLGRFNDIVNILRYEKPLQIYICDEVDKSGVWSGAITTDLERVGEEES